MEVSLAPRGIPGPVGMRTVGISGCDLEFKGMYILYFENPINGGGPINSVSVDKHRDKLFITFEDAAGMFKTYFIIKSMLMTLKMFI